MAACGGASASEAVPGNVLRGLNNEQVVSTSMTGNDLPQVVKRFLRRPAAEPFSEPVPADVEGYHDVIAHPMDLGTVAANLHDGSYSSLGASAACSQRLRKQINFVVDAFTHESHSWSIVRLSMKSRLWRGFSKVKSFASRFEVDAQCCNLFFQNVVRG